MSADDLLRQVLYAAYDAGLDDADEVTPHLVRYTYVAFLLRQGIRLADLARLVGSVSQHELTVYMRAVPIPARLPFDQIDPLSPALRNLGAAGGE